MTASPGEWPADGLQYLNMCPVCSSSRRQVRFDGVEDWSFGAAPGKWTLWQCDECRSIYPDPRPDERTIALAYRNYYTHSGSQKQSTSASGTIQATFRKHRRFLSQRISQSMDRLPVAGAVLRKILGKQKRLRASLKIRHLPLPAQKGERLLDIGCGDGGFLRIASELSYHAFGADPDPQAVAAARKRGFEVIVGALPACDYPDGHFSEITMNHVIEHVHDVRASLREAWRLLRPGGRLWLATPNADGAGLERFGKHWRGLEQPRHLVLLNATTFRQVLTDAGFTCIQFHEHPAVGNFFANQSLAMQNGQLPYEKSVAGNWALQAKPIAEQLDREAAADLTKGDILIVTARKP